MQSRITEELTDIVSKAFAAAELDPSLGAVRPADRPDLAQFQCNGALAAAKAAKQNPRALAEKIVETLRDNPILSDITIAGPGFINLKVSDEALGERVAALGKDDLVGGWRSNQVEKIVVDYGGPNVAKPLHVGHLRAAIIGEAIKRLMRFVGHDAVGDVHLGDWGLPMGQLITELALEQPALPYFDEGFDGTYPDTSPVTLDDLSRLYPQASAACKENDERAAAARAATAELQAGRRGYLALWAHFVAVSREAIEREYADLGVSFEFWKGESDADPYIQKMADDLRAKGLTEKDAGAEIVRVARETDKKELPPLILFKSDGSVLYGTTDLATIVDRVEVLSPDRILYVVDQRQGLHFEQVFRAAGMAGLFPEDRLEHLGFGTMNGRDGKPFKTRAGGVLKLRDLIDTVDQKALERLRDGGFAQDVPEDDLKRIARQVGVAALKFADLSNPRTTDYVFDVDKFMSFEGKTGPYLLYARVRIRSLIERAGGAPEHGEIKLKDPAERDLALALLGFGDAVRTATTKRMPHFLCEHAFSLAQAFSKFYASCRVADEADEALRTSRLLLAKTTGKQLDTIFGILGIDAPRRM